MLTSTQILLAIFTGLIGLLFWFLKRNFDQLDKSDVRIENKIEKVDDKVNKLDKTVTIMKGKMDFLWDERMVLSRSPLELNEFGQKIFNQSGIKKIVDKRFEYLYQKIKEKKPRNAYWVQEYTKSTVYKLRGDEKLLPKLEKAAYEAGTDIDSILFAGAIYLRNLILPKFNFKPKDIDDCEEVKSK